MSQRRQKLPDLPDGQARRHTTKIVCTWRGAHPSVVLYHLMDTRGDANAGNVVMWPEGPRNQAPLTSWNPETEGESFVFHCRRCGRNVPLTQELLFMLLDGLPLTPDRAAALTLSSTSLWLSTSCRHASPVSPHVSTAQPHPATARPLLRC